MNAEVRFERVHLATTGCRSWINLEFVDFLVACRCGTGLRARLGICENVSLRVALGKVIRRLPAGDLQGRQSRRVVSIALGPPTR